jgi:hypothetical protein
MTAAFPHRQGATKGKPQHKLNSLSLAIMVGEMVDGPFTVRSLMETSGLGRASVYRFMRTFHAKGVVHIGGWEKDAAGRVCVPVYTLGRGKDAKRPTKSKEQVNRDYAQRKRLRGATQGLTAPLARNPFAGLGAQA